MDDLAELLEGAGLSHLVKIPLPEFIKEHKRLIRLLGKRKEKAFRKEAADQAEELAKMTGASKASGFVARAMAENYLKHQGQYKNPTAPLHPGSTMNKPLAFDYRRLANAGQGGENAAAYGASPFIQKHFGQAEAVPFVRTRGVPPPLVPRPNKRRLPRVAQAPEGEVAAEQLGPVPVLGVSEVPRRAQPPPVEPEPQTPSGPTLESPSGPSRPSASLREFIDCLRLGKFPEGKSIEDSFDAYRVPQNYKDIIAQTNDLPYPENFQKLPHMTPATNLFDPTKFCAHQTIEDFLSHKKGTAADVRWREVWILLLLGGDVGVQMLSGATNYFTELIEKGTLENTEKVAICALMNNPPPLTSDIWSGGSRPALREPGSPLEKIFTCPGENYEAIRMAYIMSNDFPEEWEEYQYGNEGVLRDIRKILFPLSGLPTPRSDPDRLANGGATRKQAEEAADVGRMLDMVEAVLRFARGPSGVAKPGGAAAEPAGASASKPGGPAPMRDVYGELPVPRAVAPVETSRVPPPSKIPSDENLRRAGVPANIIAVVKDLVSTDKATKTAANKTFASWMNTPLGRRQFALANLNKRLDDIKEEPDETEEQKKRKRLFDYINKLPGIPADVLPKNDSLAELKKFAKWQRDNKAAAAASLAVPAPAPAPAPAAVAKPGGAAASESERIRQAAEQRGEIVRAPARTLRGVPGEGALAAATPLEEFLAGKDVLDYRPSNLEQALKMFPLVRAARGVKAREPYEREIEVAKMYFANPAKYPSGSALAKEAAARFGVAESTIGRDIGDFLGLRSGKHEPREPLPANVV